MMAVTVTTPFGSSTAPFQILVHGVTWDPRFYNPQNPTDPNSGFSNGVFLQNGDLTVSNLGGQGQGTIADPYVAQSGDPQGIIYWEVTWTALPNTSLVGGIGVCSFEALSFADSLPLSYDIIASGGGGLAMSGIGSVLLRPDGTVWWGQAGEGPPNQNGQQFFQPQAAGDTVGILLNFRDPRFIGVNFYGVGGSILGAIAGTFQIVPQTLVIPCAIFTEAGVGYTQTALFSRFDQGAYKLINTDFYPGIILVETDSGPIPGVMGWPGTA